MSRLLTDIKYSLIAFYRNKSMIFWTIAFPIMIMFFMVFVFGNQSGPLTLYYTDLDGSQASRSFLAALNGTGAFELKDGSGTGLAQSLKDGKISVYVEIPAGFGQNMGSGSSDVEVYYDKSKVTSMPAVSAVRQVADGLNMELAGTRQVVNVKAEDVATSSMSYVDFLLPGIIGMTIMMTCVSGTAGTTAKNRARGVFRKLATTPLSRIEWNASRIIVQTIALMVSMAISLVVAYAAFQARPEINAVSVLLVVAGGVLFAGLGSLIAVFVRDEDMVTNAASMATFPIMFISGSFMPVESMPWFLQDLAAVSPLTYLNNGLRSAMIAGSYGDAFACLAIVGAFGIVLFGLGVMLLKWRED
jgi:ABC-2 type transport system permease protein